MKIRYSFSLRKLKGKYTENIWVSWGERFSHLSEESQSWTCPKGESFVRANEFNYLRRKSFKVFASENSLVISNQVNFYLDPLGARFGFIYFGWEVWTLYEYAIWTVIMQVWLLCFEKWCRHTATERFPKSSSVL